MSTKIALIALCIALLAVSCVAIEQPSQYNLSTNFQTLRTFNYTLFSFSVQNKFFNNVQCLYFYKTLSDPETLQQPTNYANFENCRSSLLLTFGLDDEPINVLLTKLKDAIIQPQ